MIRVVFDTNVVISGTLWSGTPSFLLKAALRQQCKPLISETMLDELIEVIERPKFAERLRLLQKTGSQIVSDYLTLAEIVMTESIEPTIMADADDDEVLACALYGRAGYIVSGDPHLLEVGQYRNIPVLAPAEFLALLADLESDDGET